MKAPLEGDTLGKGARLALGLVISPRQCGLQLQILGAGYWL